MNILFKTSVLAASLLLVACNNNDDQEVQTPPSTNSSKYYQTKTPYQPQQDLKIMNKLQMGSSQFLQNWLRDTVREDYQVLNMI